MIKKLQRKFVLIVALTLLFVLGAVAAAINIVNSCQLTKNEDELFEMICQNNGTFPDFFREELKHPALLSADSSIPVNMTLLSSFRG